MTDKEFKDAVLSNLDQLNTCLVEMREEIDVLKIGLMTLCKMNGHDPEALLKVSQDIFEGKHG